MRVDLKLGTFKIQVAAKGRLRALMRALRDSLRGCSSYIAHHWIRILVLGTTFTVAFMFLNPTAAVIITLFLACLATPIGSSLPAALAFLSLVICLISLMARSNQLAMHLATWVFCFLAIWVSLLVKEMRGSRT